MLALLHDRRALRVAGKDAAAFLQGLVTNDVESLAPGDALFAALLTPQGKIISDFFVCRSVDEPDAYWLDAPLERSADLLRRLTMYKLRAAVDVIDASERVAIFAAWPDAPASDGAGARWFLDPRKDGAGWRGFAPHAAPLGDGDPSAYEAHRIALGLPKGGVDFLWEDAFPHEAGMPNLNGVSFRKGCYVGQEVVSRMQHRGTTRSRIVPLHFDGLAPAPGTEIRAGEKLIGRMGSSQQGRGLAMVRLDRLEESIAAGETLRAGETTAQIDA